jgi:hypothetical protein
MTVRQVAVVAAGDSEAGDTGGSGGSLAAAWLFKV